jgi:D-alanyl-lipoteichoic acid acyltransferase DltB (MBOAT superfamily)
MPIDSILYLAFVSFAVVAYWLLPPGWRRIFVLIASLAFYASWGIRFVWVPIAAACVVYFISKQMAADAKMVKAWMWLGISLVLALLIFFKYTGFLFGNLDSLTAAHGFRAGWATSLAFPLGISFYTFEAIGYLIDVRQGRVKMPGFLDLCLFFMFWPNILSGPIVRARELLPQLGFRKSFEPRFVFEGFDRIIWGLVQKNVVANVLGTWVDKAFALNTPNIGGTLDAWFVAIAFGLQIYFDFAGYTNIAIGAAGMLGVSLPENFRNPYHAATPVEFWARWHMTLSRWIRDYLFFPINAKWKGAPIPLYLSLFGVMGLVGLWHGAGWTFLVWGLLHGTYLVAYRVYESYGTEQRGKNAPKLEAGIWRGLTLMGVAAAWVVFRAPTLSKAGAILSAMFYRLHSGRFFSPLFYAYTLMIILLCAVEPFLVAKLSEIEENSSASDISFFRVVGRPIAYLCGLLLFLLFGTGKAQFIYSQF